jgi:hypothetical protein
MPIRCPLDDLSKDIKCRQIGMMSWEEEESGGVAGGFTAQLHVMDRGGTRHDGCSHSRCITSLQTCGWVQNLKWGRQLDQFLCSPLPLWSHLSDLPVSHGASFCQLFIHCCFVSLKLSTSQANSENEHCVSCFPLSNISSYMLEQMLVLMEVWNVLRRRKIYICSIHML